MFINLTKMEVENTITALEDLQTYLEENGMEDCTRCNLEIVKSVRQQRCIILRQVSGSMNRENRIRLWRGCHFRKGIRDKWKRINTQCMR